MDFPTTIGGTIYVKDSDELATLPIAGLPPGTTVYNEDVGAFFKLTVSARTDIEVAAGDSYDDDTWSFADADFTGLEGCTLQVTLDQPNQDFSGNFVIDTVDSATDVVVTPALGTATIGDIAGSAVVFTDALETDVTVAAAGVVGLRWVVVVNGADAITALTGDVTATGPGSAAATIAADAVTNAKLANAAARSVKANLTTSAANPTDAYIDPWFLNQIQAMKAQVPELTGFEYMKPGTNGAQFTVGANVADAAVEGGGFTVTAGAWQKFYSSSSFQTPKTGKWAVAFRGKLPAITVGELGALGLVNGAATHYAAVVTAQGVSASKYVLYFVGAGTSQALSTSDADTAVHDFLITFDTTTVKLYIDGTLEASQTTLTNISDEPLFIAARATGALLTTTMRVAYGYVG